MRRLQLSIAVISLFVLVTDALIVRSITLLAPYIRTSLGIDAGRIGYVLSALMVGTMVATLPLSSILGRASTRQTFSAILIIIGVGLLATAVQKSFLGLVAILFLLGIPRAGLIPMVNRVITENYEPTKRGSITGLLFAAVPLGGFLGAVALPAIAETFHWGAAYGLLAILALAGGITSLVLLPRDTTPASPEPLMMSLRSLGSKTFIILGITYGFFALSLTAEAYITLYLVDVVKISALLAGMFFGLIQLTGIGGRVFWGLLADRCFSRNKWWLLVFTNGLTVISFSLLVRLSSGSPYWMIILPMVGLGLSAASSWSILSTMIGDIVEISSVAVATASIFFLTTIADSIGPVLFSHITNLTGDYRNTIRIYMGIVILTTVAFAAMAFRNHLRYPATR